MQTSCASQCQDFSVFRFDNKSGIPGLAGLKLAGLSILPATQSSLPRTPQVRVLIITVRNNISYILTSHVTPLSGCLAMRRNLRLNLEMSKMYVI